MNRKHAMKTHLKIKTKVRAAGVELQHNQTLATA